MSTYPTPPQPSEPGWESRVVQRAAWAKRATGREDLDAFSPGPEHLVSDDLFAYALAQRSGNFAPIAPADLERIEAHLPQCRSCMAVLAELLETA